MDDAVVIKLSKPINAHGEEIEEIELRPPDGGDIMDIGVPFIFLGDGSYTMRADVIGKYISRLGKIPLSSVKKIDAVDMMACQGAVMGFFGESDVTKKDSSKESTTSDGSGESSLQNSGGSQ